MHANTSSHGPQHSGDVHLVQHDAMVEHTLAHRTSVRRPQHFCPLPVLDAGRFDVHGGRRECPQGRAPGWPSAAAWAARRRSSSWCALSSRKLRNSCASSCCRVAAAAAAAALVILPARAGHVTHLGLASLSASQDLPVKICLVLSSGGRCYCRLAGGAEGQRLLLWAVRETLRDKCIRLTRMLLQALQVARTATPVQGGRRVLGVKAEICVRCQTGGGGAPLRVGGGRMLLGLNAWMAGNIMSGSSACPLNRAANVIPPAAP